MRHGKRTVYVVSGILIVASFAVFQSCKHNPVAPPPYSGPQLNESNLDSIIMEEVGYNIVHVTHALGKLVKSLDVSAISIGVKDSTGLRVLATDSGEYDPAERVYNLNFDLTASLSPGEIQAPVTVRYWHRASPPSDVDTSVSLMSYPYNDARVVLTSSSPRSGISFQDVARYSSRLYFHPFGPEGLYVDDLQTGTITRLFNYGSGDHIAADSDIVYCDVSHNWIDRYHISTGQVDDKFIDFSDQSINGVALFGGYLFVLIQNQDGFLGLTKYTSNGTRLDSLSIPRYGYYMTIDDSIVYSVDWQDPSIGEISRFDLRTETYLSDLLSPVQLGDGIKIYQDTLYYCDYYRNYIGAVPMSSLRAVTTQSLKPGSSYATRVRELAGSQDRVPDVKATHNK